jgi:hypothetical protein
MPSQTVPALEPSELFEKGQWHLSNRSVALLAMISSASGYLVFRFLISLVILFPNQQTDDIRILFNRSRLTEVAQAWFTIAAAEIGLSVVL